MTLIELAEKLEAAEAGEQWRLLAAAFEAIKGPRYTWHGKTIRRHDDWLPFAKMLDANAFESAAMMLVPERHAVDLTIWGPLWAGKHRARVLPVHQDGDRWLHRGSDPDYCVNAATPALALAAAALRAHAANQEDRG